MNATYYAECMLCHRGCPADLNYCLPQCEGRKNGYAHFFCHNCWEHTLSRVKCELASCIGCHLGFRGVPFNTPPVIDEEPDADMQ